MTTLQLRIISALVLAPIVMAALVFGDVAFLALAMLIGAFAVVEWLRMAGGEDAGRHLEIAAVFAVICSLVLAGMLDISYAVVFLLCLAVLTGLGSWVIYRKRGFYTGFGIVYIGLALASMTWLRETHGLGLWAVLYLVAVVWASDICAYFAGRAIGGPKLAPKISPNKTWAGFLGGALGAAVVSSIIVYYKGTTGVFSYMSLIEWAGVAAAMGMLGQYGDLFISTLKRHYGVKDTGALIPGHGGILDRIDALLLVTLFFIPFVTFLQTF